MRFAEQNYCACNWDTRQIWAWIHGNSSKRYAFSIVSNETDNEIQSEEKSNSSFGEMHVLRFLFLVSLFCFVNLVLMRICNVWSIHCIIYSDQINITNTKCERKKNTIHSLQESIIFFVLLFTRWLQYLSFTSQIHSIHDNSPQISWISDTNKRKIHQQKCQQKSAAKNRHQRHNNKHANMNDPSKKWNKQRSALLSMETNCLQTQWNSFFFSERAHNLRYTRVNTQIAWFNWLHCTADGGCSTGISWSQLYNDPMVRYSWNQELDMGCQRPMWDIDHNNRPLRLQTMSACEPTIDWTLPAHRLCCQISNYTFHTFNSSINWTFLDYSQVYEPQLNKVSYTIRV